ncbi:MAG TPA: hypothetical protein VMM55_13755 [Thermohalobaculum sp.]|nr:hypothetical protein [Thermohalobaculum sp.]
MTRPGRAGRALAGPVAPAGRGRAAERGSRGPARPGRAGRLAVLPLLALGLSACAAPLDFDSPDRLDRVTLTAGDAQERNITMHAVDPVPPVHPRPEATYDGRRTLAVMELFYERVGAPPQGGAGGSVGGGDGGGS